MFFLLKELKKKKKRKKYLPEKEKKKISNKLKIPISRIYGILTFYSKFYTEKQGKYIIEICNSPSCYLNGSLDLIKFIEKKLKIKSNQTTKDGKFSLHISSCIGCCDKAPAMLVNGKLYGNLTKEKIKDILQN